MRTGLIRSIGRITAFLAGYMAATTTMAVGAPPITSDAELVPEIRHERIGELVTQFIQKQHYKQISVDDELSSRVLDGYLDALDGDRSYLLESDLRYFEKYRYSLDDLLKSRPLNPIYNMFKVYRSRARDRFNYALKLLDIEPDFSIDETYRFDRSEAPWAKTEAELDEIWRKRVKRDALRLVLSEKSWEEAQDILSNRYERSLRRLEQVKTDDVFETFMNAFAHTLDPHSSYLSPRRSEEYRIQMSLSYFGIGASLITEQDYVEIVNVIPGGPAAIDGSLKPKDRITGVAQGNDGAIIDVVGWRLDDVVDLIRGPKGTVVRLQIIPAGALPGSGEKEIVLSRGQVKLEEQAAKRSIIEVPRDGRDGRIGVIEVPSFYRDYRALSNGDKNYTSTTKDVRRLINELEAEGIDGLVVDLRGNGGGHLTEATALSGLFIDNGPVVQLRNANGRISRLDDPDPVARVAYEGPFAVLVDRFSASASEIFAAAIQDYRRGVIVGQQTFGKGTVQNLYSLDQYIKSEGEQSYGQLTMTIGKYYRVTGESTQHRGVNPDITLPSSIDIEQFGESVRDSALPWDTVRTARFSPDGPLNDTIESLTSNHSERTKADPNYRYLIKGIQQIEEARDRDTVSLNIDKRLAEREAERARALARENERRAALGLEPYASLEDIEEDQRPDILLDQAAQIALDLAMMRETGGAAAVSAKAAQVTP